MQHSVATHHTLADQVKPYHPDNRSTDCIGQNNLAVAFVAWDKNISPQLIMGQVVAREGRLALRLTGWAEDAVILIAQGDRVVGRRALKAGDEQLEIPLDLDPQVPVSQLHLRKVLG